MRIRNSIRSMHGDSTKSSFPTIYQNRETRGERENIWIWFISLLSICDSHSSEYHLFIFFEAAHNATWHFPHANVDQMCACARMRPHGFTSEWLYFVSHSHVLSHFLAFIFRWSFICIQVSLLSGSCVPSVRGAASEIIRRSVGFLLRFIPVIISNLCGFFVNGVLLCDSQQLSCICSLCHFHWWQPSHLATVNRRVLCEWTSLASRLVQSVCAWNARKRFQRWSRCCFIGSMPHQNGSKMHWSPDVGSIIQLKLVQ